MTDLGEILIPQATMDGRMWLGLRWVRDKWAEQEKHFL
jgi:hypothetical protein